MKKVYAIVSHPDDESFGCGATIAKHIAHGDDVHCLVMTNNYRSSCIYQHLDKAMTILGVEKYKLFDLPDHQLEKYTRMELTQILEEYVKTNGVPDIVYTHNLNDLNQDHQITCLTVSTVFRPVWDKKVSIYWFDTPSSTEWALKPFAPNVFVDIEGYLEKKIEACKCYETEFRQLPHPRSAESLESRARYWGMCCGLKYAEAFELMREVR